MQRYKLLQNIRTAMEASREYLMFMPSGIHTLEAQLQAVDTLRPIVREEMRRPVVELAPIPIRPRPIVQTTSTARVRITA